MREIKFRFWCKTLNHFVLPHDAILRGVLDGHDKDIIPMQFTGLLDKSGKEIYEGDIVRQVNLINERDEYITQVEWKDGQARFNIFQLYDKVPRNLEVIGNIYENPKLLEANP